MPPETKHDALIDDRPETLKKRDFKHEELTASASVPSFTPVASVDDIPFYELRDQDGSNTCMNQAYAKMRGIKVKQKAGQYVSLSGGFLYRRRVNQDSAGMYLHDVFEQGSKKGLPFEAIDPSQKVNDDAINNANEIPYADDVAKLFTDPDEKFIYLPNDFDTIASVISQGFPVLLMHFGNFDEYGIRPKVLNESLTPVTATIRHGVCAHHAINFMGENLIVMDDSWGILNAFADSPFQNALKARGQRILTRDWVNKRVYGAGYIRDLAFNWDGTSIPAPVKPKYTFTKALEWGMKADPDVVALQNILKYEKRFPVDQPSTGNYFGLTMSGVQDYQKSHNIVSYGTPETTGYGRVGPKTIADLNSRYSA